MPYEMRLFEDTLFGDEEVRFEDRRAEGDLRLGRQYLREWRGYPVGRRSRLDGGGEVLCAPAVTAPRSGVGRSGLPVRTPTHTATGQPFVLPAGSIAAAIADELLIRLDSVAFPPGGTALLHTHQGPGIRCLREGDIRIDTEGRSSSYCPGGAWFESGPDPVFAQASTTVPSRFIRTMVLPRSLLGASSIRYVNDEDRNRPKSQTYRVFC